MSEQPMTEKEHTLWRKNMELRMATLEGSVVELKTVVQKTNEWLAGNHDTLTEVLSVVREIKSTYKFAERLAGWGKPLIWMAATVMALLAFGKQLFAYVSGHISFLR